MVENIFHNFDFSDFWEDSEYSLQNYREEFPTDALIISIEQELGFKLPASYIELMKSRNGGILKKRCFPMKESSFGTSEYIEIMGIMGIGRTKLYSLCGSFGNQLIINEWEYPNIGVYICDTPSAGHDMVVLDYSKCGKNGEPEVVHIDQELDDRRTFLAPNFETFVRGLVSSDIYDTLEQDLTNALETFKTGQFSDTLQTYFKKDTSINFDRILRNLLTELSLKKGYFALHTDELSYLVYDIQFYLLSINKTIKNREQFKQAYLPMIALGNNDISTRGYANFFLDWFDQKISSKQIIKPWFWFGGLIFSNDYKQQLFERVKKYE